MVNTGIETMNKIRVKICGITRPEDGVFAARAGADAIGLVFYSGSLRAVSIDTAKAIISALPPFVTTVGLFVDASARDVQSVLDRVNLDILQFHGDESPIDCQQFGKRWIKAVRMQPGINLTEQAEKFRLSAGLLLDSHIAGMSGGTGQVFDWKRASGKLSKPVILAGGLNDENVADAIQMVRPYAVDVSSGVESTAGIKDPEKVARFIQRVRETQYE